MSPHVLAAILTPRRHLHAPSDFDPLLTIRRPEQVGPDLPLLVRSASDGRCSTLKAQINLSSFGLAIALVLALRFYLAHLNRKLDQAAQAVATNDEALDKAAALEGVSVQDAAAARKNWRYLL